MSGMEWFYRMEQAVKARLPELAETEAVSIFFQSDTTEQHPTYSFFMEGNDEVIEFCLIQFDPVNQEFYAYEYDEDGELASKLLFYDLEQVMQYVVDMYEEFNDFLFADSRNDFWDVEEIAVPETLTKGKIRWLTNDKHLHIETGNPDEHHEYSVLLKLGLDEENGDAVLYRRIMTEEGNNESLLHFKEEEVSYLIDMLEQYTEELYKR